MEAEIIIPLTFASRDTRIVIAGDHKQLTERVSKYSEVCFQLLRWLTYP